MERSGTSSKAVESQMSNERNRGEKGRTINFGKEQKHVLAGDIKEVEAAMVVEVRERGKEKSVRIK